MTWVKIKKNVENTHSYDIFQAVFMTFLFIIENEFNAWTS